MGMDQRKRKNAHQQYDELAVRPRSARSDSRPEAELPHPAVSYASRAQERATAAAFDGAGLSPRTAQPAGEARIDEILRANPQRPVKQKKKFAPVDVPFFMLVFGLLCFGLVMMYSASYAWAIEDYGTPHYYISRQAIFAVLGVAVMIVAAIFDYSRLKNWILIGSYFLLCMILLVMVIFYGRTANGAKRWLMILGVTFQPSEFAKFAVIYMLAWLYSIAGKRVRTFKWGMLPLLGVLAAIVPLIIVQKHISAILLIGATAGIMTFLAGARLWQIGGLLGVGVGGLAILIKFSEKFSYITNRIAIWQDPFLDPLGGGYQTIQSLYAIASGGIFGLGLGQSRQKQLYLPEAHNDYVFSIVCEELGMVGAVLLLCLFLALIVRGYWIAIHATDKFGSLLVCGIITQIALQVLMNIAVVTNAMPVTGVSLPFFSYGGTSLVLLLAEMGVVLSVSKQIRTDRKAK